MDTFPLTKEAARKKCFSWFDSDAGEPQKSPYQISDESILECIGCRKNYKITTQELRFYKEMRLPLPKFCPTCRHRTRMEKRNPLRLWERACANCGTKMQTSYAPGRPEKVYCEKCYLENVY